VHLGFLHSGHRNPDDAPAGTDSYYTLKTRNVSLEVAETPIGTTYGGYRPAEEDTDYWRIACFQLPFYTIDPTGLLGLKTAGKAWVPLDDDHMMLWNFSSPTRGAVEGPGVGGLIGQTGTVRNLAPQGGAVGAGGFRGFGYLPDTSEWLGHWRSVQDARNDYMIDRDAQAAMESYTGIAGIPEQDKAMNESMGGICDRTLEHLGTTDAMVIRTRRRLINAAKQFERTGEAPEGVDAPALYRQRCGAALLPRGQNALDVCADLIFGRSLDIGAASPVAVA